MAQLSNSSKKTATKASRKARETVKAAETNPQRFPPGQNLYSFGLIRIISGGLKAKRPDQLIYGTN